MWEGRECEVGKDFQGEIYGSVELLKCIQSQSVVDKREITKECVNSLFA